MKLLQGHDGLRTAGARFTRAPIAGDVQHEPVIAFAPRVFGRGLLVQGSLGVIAGLPLLVRMVSVVAPQDQHLRHSSSPAAWSPVPARLPVRLTPARHARFTSVPWKRKAECLKQRLLCP